MTEQVGTADTPEPPAPERAAEPESIDPEPESIAPAPEPVAPSPVAPEPDPVVAPAVAKAAKPATKGPASARSAPRRAPAAARRAESTGAIAAPVAPAVVPPLRPTTLAIDVGGTGLKASVLDAAGKLVADRVRIPTRYPCAPKDFINALTSLVAPLPDFDRVSVGFNGVVRKGVILTAPHFVTRSGAPGAPVVSKLLAAWTGFDLAAALMASFGRPVRLANDADLQGLEVVSGSGLELVVTLGTGVGTGLFLDGKLMPHLELSHHPFRRDQTYDEQLGEAALRKIGVHKWRKRVDEAFANFYRLLNYDRLYVGGGNSRLLVGYLDASVTIVDNVAGILGGIKLWELPSAEAPD
ncbi:MAG: ROK family protein [Acidimicrobiales bacterium]|jgi:polyphosphate glucokinase